jgi:mannose/cellobiose epimerase-like protein (N-acyl-D-glucosamine 2-epimerase family)
MSYRDPQFLRDHIKSIIEFYYPTCMDEEFGGYINQLSDDGSVFDRHTKHLVGTCRFIYNFSLSWLVLGDERYRDAAEHGLRFLREHHRQPDGDFAWVLQDRTVVDPTRHCYGHAFALLAAAGATKAGIDGARAMVDEIWQLLELRFWEPDAQLYVDEIAGDDWSAISPYRGQNCNMHMCEAMIASFEATGEARFIERASVLARRVCLELSAHSDGLVWEHYQSDWQPDWDYNRDDPKNLFRPYGYLPGHLLEWSKLLVLLQRHSPEPWRLPTAERLFQTAFARGWDSERGGINYAFAPDGAILDTDRYYWVTSEAIAASAVLAAETGRAECWDWYDRNWAFADRHFVDHRHGGWYRVLDRQGNRYSNEKSPAAKTDYHPLAACFEILEVLKRLSPPTEGVR